MVTEKFQFTGITHDGKATEKSRRTVTITGKKDLLKFAEVLRAQARDASQKGDNANALRLQNAAGHVEHARKFTMDVPLDAKLNTK